MLKEYATSSGLESNCTNRLKMEYAMVRSGSKKNLF